MCTLCCRCRHYSLVFHFCVGLVEHQQPLRHHHCRITVSSSSVVFGTRLHILMLNQQLQLLLLACCCCSCMLTVCLLFVLDATGVCYCWCLLLLPVFAAADCTCFYCIFGACVCCCCYYYYCCCCLIACACCCSAEDVLFCEGYGT